MPGSVRLNVPSTLVIVDFTVAGQQVSFEPYTSTPGTGSPLSETTLPFTICPTASRQQKIVEANVRNRRAAFVFINT
jgi:hypothetical protein